MKEAKTKYLGARVTEATHDDFHKKAKQFGDASDVLRELVTAFNEDRLDIRKPTVTSKKELLYVPRIQD